MTRPPVTLQGTLLTFAGVLGALAMAAMIVTVLMAATTARELAAFGRTAITEERIGNRLVDAAHSQRAAAFMFIQSRDPAAAEEFRARGRDFYAAVREYLFREMPLEARLRVERVREAHERFEVVALRSFELALEDGRPGFGSIVRAAEQLSSELQQFQAMRDRDRSQFTAMREARLARMQWVALALALLVAFGLAAGLFMLRRVVLRPLRDFERAARRLGEGDETAQVPHQAFAEFAMVGDSFNQMADNLQRTRRDLVQHEKLSAMGQMLAGLAHELNNPLAAILATAEVLELELGDRANGAAGDDPGVALATQLTREARRARDLVRNLLNLSRRSDGVMLRVDVGAIVREAVQLRAPAFAGREKAIRVQVTEPLYVIVEPIRLEVALVNLLNNALDALGERGTGVTLSARRIAQGDTSLVEIAVTDDGPGFAHPDRVFEPFYTTKPVGQGTGLGLALVHRFVQDAGGRVRASNVASGGASVVMTLEEAAPVPRGQTPPTGLASGSLSAARVVPPTMSPLQQRRPVVLVVDDEEAMRQVQVRMLQRIGLEVITAESGVTARRLLEQQPVDLVISDVRMPGELDGVGLIRWLRHARPQLAESAFIMTGDINLGGIAELGIPSDRVLAKPFDMADYVQRVVSALAQGADGATGPRTSPAQPAPSGSAPRRP